MSWGEEQKKEIETIRERKITVKLTDADCDRAYTAESLMDTVGGVMYVEYKNGEVRECQK